MPKQPKRAAAAAPTLKQLYAGITGDTDSHQRRIDAYFRRLDPGRQSIIRDRLNGLTMAVIGRKRNITAAAVRSSLMLSCGAIRKAIAGEPRYNKNGRGSGWKHAKKRAGRRPI